MYAACRTLSVAAASRDRPCLWGARQCTQAQAKWNQPHPRVQLVTQRGAKAVQPAPRQVEPSSTQGHSKVSVPGSRDWAGRQSSPGAQGHRQVSSRGLSFRQRLGWQALDRVQRQVISCRLRECVLAAVPQTASTPRTAATLLQTASAPRTAAQHSRRISTRLSPCRRGFL